MKYTVIITPEAASDLEEAFEWLAGQTQHAADWYNGAIDALFSLEENPERCPVAPESPRSPVPLRQLIYGDKVHGYRIIFSIREDRVEVLHIRHGARLPRA